jgi:uncharacterized protein YcfL
MKNICLLMLVITFSLVTACTSNEESVTKEVVSTDTTTVVDTTLLPTDTVIAQ